MKAKYPVPVQDVNDGYEKVLMIACGANFSLCYTELGIIYYWGMLIPDNYETISWWPNFLTVSLPKDFTEEQVLNF